MKKKILLITILSTIVHSTWSQSLEKNRKELDAFIENGMELWEVPGMAVAVVKDGETVFIDANGRRSLQENGEVDRNTLFAMASTTKAVSAVALAMLVDEGKCSWDDRVVDHLPEFELPNSQYKEDARVRDLLIHNLGMGNADFLWIYGDFTPAEKFEMVKHQINSYPLRGDYTYQNIMYDAAGALIERLSGKSWAEFIDNRIFQPLGMDRTIAFRRDAEAKGNFVEPHYKYDEEVEVVPYMSADAIGAAGSAMSSITDMSKWMTFLLNEGIVDGDTLLQPATYRELFKPQHLISQSKFYPTTALTNPNWTSYGLAWFQHDYMGEKVDFHTGSLAGLVAICGLIRDQNLGVYVFGNLDHAELRHAIMYKAFDLYATGGDRDWNKEIYELYAGFAASGKEAIEKMWSNRKEGTTTSVDIKEFVGTYKNKGWGTVDVNVEGDALSIHVNNYRTINMMHWHHDTFKSKEKELWAVNEFLTFRLGADGTVQAFTWDSGLLQGQVFEKVE